MEILGFIHNLTDRIDKNIFNSGKRSIIEFYARKIYEEFEQGMDINLIYYTKICNVIRRY